MTEINPDDIDTETCQPDAEILRHPAAGNATLERARLKALARPLVYYSEFSKVAQLDWRVKGYMANGHTSYCVGPPGSGKSAKESSISVYVAAGIDWHGLKIKKKYATVHFAFERADLVKKRIWAESEREGFGDVAVTVAPGLINLMDPKCIDVIIGTILEAEDHFGVEVGVATFDTYNKGISAGGGDENTAKDQNIMWGNLRRVHEGMARYHLLHLKAIGHTGKDESRGARGSNAADGDNDVGSQISKIGDIRDVAIVKANELAEGSLVQFKMEPYDTGLKDDDGEPIEIWIVANKVIKTQAGAPDDFRLSRNQRTAFSILHDAGPGGLTTEQWNEKLRDIGIGVKRRADLLDIRGALKSKQLVREFTGRWTVHA